MKKVKFNANDYTEIMKFYALIPDETEESVEYTNIFYHIGIYKDMIENIRRNFIVKKDFRNFRKETINIVKRRMMFKMEYELSVVPHWIDELDNAIKTSTYKQFDLNKDIICESMWLKMIMISGKKQKELEDANFEG